MKPPNLPPLIKAIICWPIFLISIILLEVPLLSSLAFCLVIYIIVGGWDFLEIFIRTCARDGYSLFCLIKVQLYINYAIRKKLSIPLIFQGQAKKYPNKIAFRYEDHSWTFEEVENITNQIANFFLANGFKRDDTVALLMEARPEFVFTWLGLGKANIVTSLINYNLTGDSLLHCLEVSNIQGIVVGNEFLERLSELHVRGDLDKLVSGKRKQIDRSFRALSEDTNSNGGSPRPSNGLSKKANALPIFAFHHYDLKQSSDSMPPAVNFRDMRVRQLESLLPASSTEAPPRSFSHGFMDPLIYIFTSGTTGLPKPARISHARFYNMCQSYGTFTGIKTSDVIYACLPIYHSNNGILSVGQALLNGCTVVIRKKFSASAFWADCVKYDVTTFMYVGEICRYLLGQPVSPHEKNHKVRFCGGNGLRPQLWPDFQKRFNIPRICELYGSTEGNCNLLNIEGKTGAVGFMTRIAPFLYPVCLIQMDPLTGEPIRGPDGFCIECPPGQNGELIGKITKSPIRNFDGYLKKEESQKKILTDVFCLGDKYFRSGDILSMDRYGYLYFSDRTGDTFRWKGENASTLEVEGAICKLLKLHDCSVYGVTVPDNEGRAGMAAIRATPTQTDGPKENNQSNGSILKTTSTPAIDLVELAEHLRRELPNYARPVFLRIVQELPSTGTFKLVKGPLVKAAYNPRLCGDDPLFYCEPKTGRFLPLTEEVYARIEDSTLRL